MGLSDNQVAVLYTLSAICRYNTERGELTEELIRRFLREPLTFDVDNELGTIRDEEKAFKNHLKTNHPEAVIPREFSFKFYKQLAATQFSMDRSLDYVLKRYGPFGLSFKEKYGYDLLMPSVVAMVLLDMLTDRAKTSELRNVEYRYERKEDLINLYFLAVPSKEYVTAWNSITTFSTQDFISRLPSDMLAVHDKSVFLEVLHRLVFQLAEAKTSQIDFTATPILKLNDNTFIIIKPQYLVRCLPQRYEFMFKDIQPYLDSKGKIFESLALDTFKKLSNAQLRSNIHYDDGELDGLVTFSRSTWFIECSSHQPSDSSMNGDVRSIARDLRKSVIKCYNQAKKAISSKNHLNFKNIDIKDFVGVIVVVEGSYPNINANTLEGIQKDIPLWVVNFVDLERLAEQPDIKFLEEFLIWRTQSDMPIICYDECDYWAWYAKMKEDPEMEQHFNAAKNNQIRVTYSSTRFNRKPYLEKLANK